MSARVAAAEAAVRTAREKASAAAQRVRSARGPDKRFVRELLRIAEGDVRAAEAELEAAKAAADR